MNRAEFLEEVALILEEDPGEVDENTELITVAGWDSTGLLGLIAFLSGEVEVDVDVDQIRACKTIGDIVSLAEAKLD